MTTVRVRFTPNGTPTPGQISFVARHDEDNRPIVSGRDILDGNPEWVSVPVEGADVEVRPNDPGWHYVVRVKPDGHPQKTGTFTIPPNGPINFGDLVRYDPKAGMAYEPDPEWWAWVRKIQEREGVPGDDAYQVAVNNGFSGTEQEWLASLKGPKGNPGPTGPKGDPGSGASDVNVAAYIDGEDTLTRAAVDWSTAQHVAREGSSTRNALLVGFATKALGEDGTIAVAPRTGDDGHDGLSWGRAKATLTGALAALPASGGTILIGGGTIYEANVEIDRDNVTVQGVGHDSAIDSSGVDKSNSIVAIGRDNIHILGLTVIGSGRGSQPANPLGPPTMADLANSGCGIILAACTNSRVIANTLEWHGGTTGTGDFNGVAGIWLTAGCADCTVERNTVRNSRNGINEDNYYQINPHGNKILFNTVEDCWFGIAADSESALTGLSKTPSTPYPVAYNTLIQGNTVRRCGQAGIDLNKARQVWTVNNYVDTCGTFAGNSGIVCYGSTSNYATDNIISHNMITNCGKPGTGGHGIKLADFAYGTKVEGNIVIGSVAHGIFAQGAIRYTDVLSNTVIECSGDGIFFDGTTFSGGVATNKVIGNTVRQCGESGMDLRGFTGGVIANNMLRNNSQSSANGHDGLRLTNASTQNTITGNTVRGSRHRFSVGITDSDSVNNTWEGNDFGEPFDTGAAVGVDYATARLGIAAGAERQHWGANRDRLKTTSGAPTGTWPNSAEVINQGDQRVYYRMGGAWRYVASTAA